MSLLVEMLVGPTWTDITSDVYTRGEITIGRGKADEAGQAAPASCSLTLNNRDGKYSPRNPLSPYYGQIGRNTQLRVGETADAVFDAHSTANGTGDLSWVHTPVGTPTGVCVFVWQYNTNTGQINSVTYGGVEMERHIFGLFLFGATNVVGYMYFLGHNVPPGPQTVAVDTTATILRQASAITVTGGTDAELDVTVRGYSNVNPSVNPALAITTTKRSLLLASLLSDLDTGDSISAGPGWTEVAEVDLGTEIVSVERAAPGALDPGAYFASWFAPSGHWGIMAIAVRAVNYRFHGEVSSFPARWDLSHKDKWVPIEAASILRRLGQGTDPAETGLRNFIYPATGLFRYWPLSGASGTQYSLDISPLWNPPLDRRFLSLGGHSLATGSFKYGEPMGSPYLGTGMALFNTIAGAMRGDVRAGEPNWAWDCVFQSLELGTMDTVFHDYNGRFWRLVLNGTTGTAQVTFTDPVIAIPTTVFSATGVLPELNDQLPHHVRFKLLKNGADTDWFLYIDGVQVDTGTQTSYEAFGMQYFDIDYTRTGTESYVNLAHIAVWADTVTETWPSATLVNQAANGYAGETAGVRIERIVELAGHDLTTIGIPSDTQVMGPQYNEGTLTQLRDAETTDLGVLADARNAAGLLFRTHRSLYNQAPALTLQYDSGQVSPPFEPVDDDLLTRNDITAVRRDGGSNRTQQDTGALSVLAPPDGVGRYRDEVTVNVESDDMLPAVAGWLLHVGTLDEARFPTVTVNLAAPDVAALAADVLAVDLGDRIVIQDADAVNIHDDISLIVLGYTETIGPVEHVITFNCVPGTSYEVIELDDPDSRISSGDASTLTSSLTTTATAMSVTSTAGTLWTTAAGDMPISLMIGGEEMTVTAITGASSPQTFTVTRSVNGVVKTHSAGEVVRLKRRAVWAL